jgi:hypothetical protein
MGFLGDIISDARRAMPAAPSDNLTPALEPAMVESGLEVEAWAEVPAAGAPGTRQQSAVLEENAPGPPSLPPSMRSHSPTPRVATPDSVGAHPPDVRRTMPPERRLEAPVPVPEPRVTEAGLESSWGPVADTTRGAPASPVMAEMLSALAEQTRLSMARSRLGDATWRGLPLSSEAGSSMDTSERAPQGFPASLNRPPPLDSPPSSPAAALPERKHAAEPRGESGPGIRPGPISAPGEPASSPASQRHSVAAHTFEPSVVAPRLPSPAELQASDRGLTGDTPSPAPQGRFVTRQLNEGMEPPGASPRTPAAAPLPTPAAAPLPTPASAPLPDPRASHLAAALREAEAASPTPALQDRGGGRPAATTTAPQDRDTGPRVQIGRVEVIVVARQPETRSSSSAPATDLSSRRYLRKA